MATTGSPSPPEAPIEDEDDNAELPMTMAASVIIEQLPRDAHKALETAGELEQTKGEYHRSPVTAESTSLPQDETYRREGLC